MKRNVDKKRLKIGLALGIVSRFSIIILLWLIHQNTRAVAKTNLSSNSIDGQFLSTNVLKVNKNINHSSPLSKVSENTFLIWCAALSDHLNIPELYKVVKDIKAIIISRNTLNDIKIVIYTAELDVPAWYTLDTKAISTSFCPAGWIISFQIPNIQKNIQSLEQQVSKLSN